MDAEYTYQMRMLVEEVRKETDNELVRDLLDILVRHTGSENEMAATHCGLLAIIIQGGSKEALRTIYAGIQLVAVQVLFENTNNMEDK